MYVPLNQGVRLLRSFYPSRYTKPFCTQAIPCQVWHRINHGRVKTIKDTFITAVLVLQILWARLNIRKPLQLCVQRFYWYCTTEIQNRNCARFPDPGSLQRDKKVSYTLLTCKAAFCWAAICCCSAWSRKSLLREGLESAMLQRES